MVRRSNPSYTQQKLKKQNKEIRLECKKRKEEGNPYSVADPKKTIKKTKSGTFTNRSGYNQLRQDLKAASRPNVKRKPSLPKLPWDKD